MAAYFLQYTLTASAASLTSAFGLSRTFRAQQIDVKNADGALNPVFLGGSGVTNVPANAGVRLNAGQSFTFLPTSGRCVNSDEVFIVGTVNAANIAHITVIE
jgi:hypothetical protein